MNRELYDKLIFEVSRPGRSGYQLPDNNMEGETVAAPVEIPADCLRHSPLDLPECDELSVVRHYNNMSTNNFGVDTGFYPLGSCTMKYNPKINEEMARHRLFANSHPYTPAWAVQGNLEIYWRLERALCEICGMEAFTLNPFAGAHGELTGLMVIRAYHNDRGDTKRTKVIVPDSAHGTNPASAAVCGLEVVEVKSLADGTIDVDSLKEVLAANPDSIAAMMMTNPNTLGIFERRIPEIQKLVHEAGGLMYYDGANLNPMLGVARPGDMGFDVMHVNLHKTFSTPHGGGGPGAGPVGVRAGLEQFLPSPKVVSTEDGYEIVCDDKALGSVSTLFGNFGVHARALAYILALGSEGLMQAGPLATLNANYVKEKLRDDYLLPVDTVCKHEFVFDGLKDKSEGVTTLHVAKRLLDYGFHAPTIYFPLLFHESLMIEPTETESLETLDTFIDVMHRIAAEARQDPEMVKSAPHNTPISHPDDTQAALNPVTTYDQLTQQDK